jgi:hypothetical protein
MLFSDLSQPVDRNGQPLAYAYRQYWRNNALMTVYSDIGRTKPHPSDIRADLAGRFPAVYVPDGTYLYTVKTFDTDGNPITTVDAGSAPTDATTTTGPGFASLTESTVLTAAQFAGTTDVTPPSASPVVITFPLAKLATKTSGVIRHRGSQGTVILKGQGVEPTDDAPAQVLRPGDTAAVGCDGARFLITARVDGQPTTWTIVSRKLTTPPASPTPGAVYLAATAAVAPWLAGKLFKADGAGNWLRYTPQIGDLGVILDELKGTAPLLTVYKGTAFIDANSVASQMAEFALEAPSGTVGSTAVYGAWTAIPLNVTRINNVSGLSLAAGVVTLPVGLWKYDALAAITGSGLRLRAVTNNVTDAGPQTGQSSGIIDANAGSTSYALEYYLPAPAPTTPVTVGIARSTGAAEVWATLRLFQ